jgi:hypothetical protein
LAAPLDLVVVGKIGAPFEAELAIGAIADGADPELVKSGNCHVAVAESRRQFPFQNILGGACEAPTYPTRRLLNEEEVG